MPRLLNTLLVSACCIHGLVCHAQSFRVPIYIDGAFEDWPVQPGTPFIRATSDSDGVYVYFQLPGRVVFQGEADLALYFDTDADAGTGFEGFEIRWEAGSRLGTLFNVNGTSSGQVYHDDIGLVVAPTIDSDAFELVLSRSIFSGAAARVKVVHPSSGFSESIDFDLEDTSFSSVRESGRPEFSDVRVCSYNVHFDGLWDPAYRGAFESEIASLQPEIIAFQEIYSHTASQTLQWAQGVDSNYTHSVNGADCHIISKYPIADFWALDGNAAARIILGAGKEMILINVHLPCCSSVAGRQNELSTINDFISDVRGGNLANVAPTIPVLAAGDFNFVDSDSANIAGFETDSSLSRTRFLQLDDNTSATWENPASSFSPGQLDWLFVSEGLIPLNHFIAKGTHPSDHLPVVVDLAFDSDSDFLPDPWELFFFENLSASPLDHSDSDLIANGAEFLLGTSPISNSIPPALNVSNPSAGVMSLQWKARYTTRYSIEMSTELSTWQEVDWGLSSYLGTAEVLLEDLELGSQTFFRLRME